ncbi:Prenylated Rab acceptor 1 [Saitoella coloradoensis]
MAQIIPMIRERLSGMSFNVPERFRSERFANLRPLNEFFDIRRVSKPAHFGDVTQRVNYNLSRFSSNYAVIFAMLCFYSLISNPLLLFVIGLVVGGMFLIGKLNGEALSIGPIQATTSQLYTGLLIVAVPLGFLASPISTVFWLLGASAVTILGHASFLEPPVESAFEEQQV